MMLYKHRGWIAFGLLAGVMVLCAAGGYKLSVPLIMKERSGAIDDEAAYGQLWVKDDVPNTIWFTDDGGTDYQLGIPAIPWASTSYDDLTWSDGGNATNTWTFDVSGTDTTLIAGDGTLTYSGAFQAADYYAGTGNQGASVTKSGLVFEDGLYISGDLSVVDGVTTVGEGTAIDVADPTGPTATVSFDSTELGTTTWGSGSEIAWTFDAGATPPVLTFGSATVALTDSDFHIAADSQPLRLGAETTDYTVQWDGSDAVHTVTSGDFVFMGGNVAINEAAPSAKFQITDTLQYKVKAIGVSGGDYRKTVILLHEIYDATPLGQNYTIGTIYATRGSAISTAKTEVAHITSEAAYSTATTATLTSLSSNSLKWKLVTCTYGGEPYLAIELPYTTSYLAHGISFEGFHKSTATEGLKLVDYYNVNTTEVYNSEINGSIADFTNYGQQYVDTSLTSFSNKVGIGELAPVDPFHVVADTSHKNIYLEENSGSEYWELGINAAGDCTLYDTGSAAVTFEDGGNVGINETDPAYLLDVNGTLRADSYYSNDGSEGNTASASGLEFKNGLYISGSVTAGTTTDIEVTDTTDSETWFGFWDDQTGVQTPKSDGGAYYNASTGRAYFTGVQGDHYSSDGTQGDTQADISGLVFKDGLYVSGDVDIAGIGEIDEGTAIDVTNGTGPTATIAFNSTELGTTTWGSGSEITWIYNVGATDPQVTFTSGVTTFDNNTFVTQAVSGATDIAYLANNDWTDAVGSALGIASGAASGNTYISLQAYDEGVVSTNALVLQPGGGAVGIGTDTTPDGMLDITGTATNTVRLYVDGASAPYTGTAQSYGIYTTHKVDTVGAEVAYGTIALLTMENAFDLDASPSYYGMRSIVDNSTATFQNTTVTDRVVYNVGANADLNSSAAYDTTSTGYVLSTNWGVYSDVDVTETFTDTGGNSPANKSYSYGVRATVDVANTLTSGTLTEIACGLVSNVSITDAGNSTAYGLWIGAVGTADANYGIWDDSGKAWVLDGDAQYIYMGEAQTDYYFGWQGTKVVHAISAGWFDFQGGDIELDGGSAFRWHGPTGPQIVDWQDGADADQRGLKVYTHSSATYADAADLVLTIDADGTSLFAGTVQAAGYNSSDGNPGASNADVTGLVFEDGLYISGDVTPAAWDATSYDDLTWDAGTVATITWDWNVTGTTDPNLVFTDGTITSNSTFQAAGYNSSGGNPGASNANVNGLVFENGLYISGSVDAPAAWDSTTYDGLTWSDDGEASFVWTFDVSGTNTTLTFGDGSIAASGSFSATSVVVGTMTMGDSTITSSGTTISFGSENIYTTGALQGGAATVTTVNTGSGAMDLGDAAVTNGDADSVPTNDQVYDFVFARTLFDFGLPADPGADRYLMWDDSETGNELVWATVVPGAADITAVGDCASGDAFDGTLNQGTWLKFYDADGIGQLIIDSANVDAAHTWYLPNYDGRLIVSGHTFTGDVAGTLGTSNTTALTIQADSVALTTDTTGDYVYRVTAGNYIDIDNETGEGVTATIAVDPTEMGTVTWGPDDPLVWTFDAGGASNPVVSFNNAAVAITGADGSIAGTWTVSDGTASYLTVGNQTASSTSSTITQQGKSGAGAALAATWTLGSDGYYDLATQGTYNAMSVNMINGKVGFNQTAPTTYLVEVNGTFQADDYYSGDGTIGASVTKSGLVFKDGLYVSGDLSVVDGVTTVTAGTAIDVTNPTGPEATVNWDSTEVAATTWGDGTAASFIWSYNVSGTDHTLTFGSGSIAASGSFSAASVTVDQLTMNNATITSSTGTISLDNENLYTTGTFQAGAATVTTVNTGSGAMDLGDAAVANGDADSIPTGDQVYDFVFARTLFDFGLPADPNADRYLMWDDDPGELVWAEVVPGTGDITAVGDCASGAAFDGTLGQGTYLDFYDDGGVGRLIIDSTMSAGHTWTLPNYTGNVIVSGHAFTGDVAGTLDTDNGTALTIQADSVALTTDTTGNYVATLTEGNYIDVTNGTGEGLAATVAVDPTEMDTIEWGDGTAIAWTFNASAGTDTTLTWGDGTLIASGSFKAADYYAGTGNQGASVTKSGLVFEDGLYISGDLSVVDGVTEVAAGTGIDVATGTGPTATVSFDATDLDAITWSDGANASNAWTFDLSGVDPTVTFGSASVAVSAAGDTNVTISSTDGNEPELRFDQGLSTDFKIQLDDGYDPPWLRILSTTDNGTSWAGDPRLTVGDGTAGGPLAGVCVSRTAYLAGANSYYGVVVADAWNHTTAAKSYCAFDALPYAQGVRNIAHVIGFQSRPQMQQTGTADYVTGVGSMPAVSANAVITDLYHFAVTDVVNTGTVTRQHGLYIATLDSATTSYGITIGNTDVDQNLLHVGVTGDPTLIWDESEDGFVFSHVIQTAGYKSSDGTAGRTATVDGLVFKNGLCTSGSVLPADPGADRYLMWDDSETGSELVWAAGTGGGIATVTAGTAIDVTTVGDDATVNFDSTEVNNTTWGDAADTMTWTFNSSATVDPTIIFGTDSVTFDTGIQQAGCTTNGGDEMALGIRSVANVTCGVATGVEALAGRYAEHAQSSGSFTAEEVGEAQTSVCVLRCQTTTDTTPVTMTLDTSDGSGTEIAIRDETTVGCMVTIVGRRDTGAASFYGTYTFALQRTGGTTAEVAAFSEVKRAGSVYASPSITADDGDDVLHVTMQTTEGTPQNWNWVARVEITEVYNAD